MEWSFYGTSKEGQIMRLGFRSIAVIGGLILGLALPASADAWYSKTEGSVSLRIGPGVNYKRIATIPAGATIWVDWCKLRWCSVAWKGLHGFVAASYVAGWGVQPRAYYYGHPGYWWLFYHDHPRYRPHKPPHKPPYCKPGECERPNWGTKSPAGWGYKPPRFGKKRLED
jgi:hypothetical protein